MGKSLPPPAGVDLVHSFARVVDGDVEIVLTRPEVSLAPGADVVLRRGKRRQSATLLDEGTDDTRRLVVRLPRTDLDDGTWAVRLRSAGEVITLQARLLVQGERPVVLLWGAEGTTSRLPDPHPRDSRPGPATTSAVDRPNRPGRARRLTRTISRRVRRSF